MFDTQQLLAIEWDPDTRVDGVSLVPDAPPDAADVLRDRGGGACAAPCSRLACGVSGYDSYYLRPSIVVMVVTVVMLPTMVVMVVMLLPTIEGSHACCAIPSPKTVRDVIIIYYVLLAAAEWPFV